MRTNRDDDRSIKEPFSFNFHPVLTSPSFFVGKADGSDRAEDENDEEDWAEEEKDAVSKVTRQLINLSKCDYYKTKRKEETNDTVCDLCMVGSQHSSFFFDHLKNVLNKTNHIRNH